ncbi:unnamed protein product [Periconia digitata]|uniref:Uncharacterized protein n=1 Tax=Periconia digitata TaxID=1303443 RepID=A0A9W4USJ8_9PLEO|nr:unnamed protein product [Periconia digitata]
MYMHVVSFIFQGASPRLGAGTDALLHLAACEHPQVAHHCKSSDTQHAPRDMLTGFGNAER